MLIPSNLLILLITSFSVTLPTALSFVQRGRYVFFLTTLLPRPNLLSSPLIFSLLPLYLLIILTTTVPLTTLISFFQLGQYVFFLTIPLFRQSLLCPMRNIVLLCVVMRTLDVFPWSFPLLLLLLLLVVVARKLPTAIVVVMVVVAIAQGVVPENVVPVTSPPSHHKPLLLPCLPTATDKGDGVNWIVLVGGCLWNEPYPQVGDPPSSYYPPPSPSSYK